MNRNQITILLIVIILFLSAVSCGLDTQDRSRTSNSGKTSPEPTPLKTDDEFSTFNADQYETKDIYNITSILEPTSSPALHKKAILLRRGKKYRESIKVLERAIELYPAKAGLWFGKGKTYTCMGDFKKAEECMVYSARIKPGPEIWYFTGVLKAYNGKFEEAMQCFDRSIALKSSPHAWYSKGITYDDLEKNQEALECYNKVLEINKEYPAVWYSKGIVLLEINRYDEARNAFTQANKLGYLRAEKALNALTKKGF